MANMIDIVSSGWIYDHAVVLTDLSNVDLMYLEVYAEKTDPVTCNAYPVKALMKIYSNEFNHLREYIVKNAPKRVDLYRTDGGELCIMIGLTY